MGKITARIAIILSSVFLAGNLILDHDYFFFASLIVSHKAILPPWGWAYGFYGYLLPTKWVYVEADLWWTMRYLWLNEMIVIPIAAVLLALSVTHLSKVNRNLKNSVIKDPGKGAEKIYVFLKKP